MQDVISKVLNFVKSFDTQKVLKVLAILAIAGEAFEFFNERLEEKGLSNDTDNPKTVRTAKK